MTAEDVQKLMQQSKILENKLDRLTNSLAFEIGEDNPYDPVKEIIALLSEIVRAQQVQQQWIEAIAAKMDYIHDAETGVP